LPYAKFIYDAFAPASFSDEFSSSSVKDLTLLNYSILLLGAAATSHVPFGKDEVYRLVGSIAFQA